MDFGTPDQQRADAAEREAAELRRQVRHLEEELERAKHPPCNVCTGERKLLTGEPCLICEQTGLEYREIIGLRKLALRGQRAEASYAALIEKARGWRRAASLTGEEQDLALDGELDKLMGTVSDRMGALVAEMDEVLRAHEPRKHGRLSVDLDAIDGIETEVARG